ncbi:unnamed protein product [Moneuplotes crassus]|uniref:Uncharacterized protein n=1 Tax=Euplotes crassus TaxID=5936 RepID=A0AAD1XXY4_EUPCR|nr:unnamed protein product [Moneuplotes crassus]
MLVTGIMIGILIRLMYRVLMSPSKRKEPIPDKDYGFDDVQVHVYFSPRAEDPDHDFNKAVQASLMKLKKRCAKYRTRYYLAINKQWYRNKFKIVQKAVTTHDKLKEIINICDELEIAYNEIKYFSYGYGHTVGYSVGPVPKLHFDDIKQRIRDQQSMKCEE